MLLFEKKYKNGWTNKGGGGVEEVQPKVLTLRTFLFWLHP